jgi:hypothetical protein
VGRDVTCRGGDNEVTGAPTGLAVEVAAEIRSLRKGRGVQANNLDSVLGPLLQELTGPDASDAVARRQALCAELDRCSAQLPDDLRIAVGAALALSAPTRPMPYTQDRVNWLATQLRRQPRTARRRMDAAELRLAEVIARELQARRDHTVVAPDGWYLDEFRVLFRLDTEAVESYEVRRIVSVQPGLAEVEAWLDLPRSADQPAPVLQAEMQYGGRLITTRQASRNRFHLTVRLPKPLQQGEPHEYGLILRLPREMLATPHYVLTPECKCNNFDLRVRFDLNQLPIWVRRVERETVRTFDNGQPIGKSNLVRPDEAGEVHQEFHNLAMYLGYGLQWQPSA